MANAGVRFNFIQDPDSLKQVQVDDIVDKSLGGDDIEVTAEGTEDTRTLSAWTAATSGNEEFTNRLQSPSGASQVGFNENQTVGDVLTNLPINRASIIHRRENGIIYDVIRASGQIPILKKYNTDTDSNGVQTRIAPGALAKKLGYPAAINCDNFSAPDGSSYTNSETGKSWGLQIVDGIAYRDWDENAIDVALVVMRDGTVTSARKTDGKSAQDWVDEGALWCVSGRGLAVEGGVTNDISGYPGNDNLSARNIFGIDANGDYVIIMVEGVSGSYGATANGAGQVALENGAVLAISLDAGGSTQSWWGDCYALPSSDNGPRGVVGALVFNMAGVPYYDSGIVEVGTTSLVTGPNLSRYPSLYLRQTGSSVRLSFNANTDVLSEGTYSTVADTIPIRYLSDNDRTMKGFIDTGEDFGKTFVSSGQNCEVKSYFSDGNRVTGNMTWESRFSSEPEQ